MKRKKITCESARKISIIKVLFKMGYSPEKENQKEAWFLSPFHVEAKASFKVSLIMNCWYDHSIGKGGNVIDLVMQKYQCSVKSALNYLNEEANFFSFHQQPKLKIEKNYSIKELKKLNNIALLDYLKNRGISRSNAYSFCEEIYYSLQEKSYFAIAFKNDLGGFEIRNKYIKGALGKKGYTTISNNSNSINVFEGFIDFLSYNELSKKELNEDYLILNSVSTAEKVIPKLQNYSQVNLFLDNDIAGKKTVSLFKSKINNLKDFSFRYKEYKDLNEFLCAKSIS